MTPRASPVRHKVKSHIRNGHRVSSYYRGESKGKSPSMKGSRKTRRVKDDDGGGGKWENFTVTLIYSDDSLETLPVMARDADDALSLALDTRHSKRKKVKTCIVQDGLGDVVKRAVRESAIRAQQLRIQKAAIEGRVKHIKGSPKRFRKQLSDEKRSGEIEALVKAGQSSNQFKAKAARKELKKKYPVVYRNIAWKRV